VVYSSLFDKKPTVTLAACMAQVRRKFDEAVSYDAVRSTYAVAQIARLYAIEQQIRDAPDLDKPDICQKRLREAIPILEELKAWLDMELGRVSSQVQINDVLNWAKCLSSLKSILKRLPTWRRISSTASQSVFQD
jgi:transposase